MKTIRREPQDGYAERNQQERSNMPNTSRHRYLLRSVGWDRHVIARQLLRKNGKRNYSYASVREHVS